MRPPANRVLTNNQAMAKALANQLGVDVDQVLTASTGKIGPQIEMDKILPAVPELVERATTVADVFALAILTTDLVPKAVTTTVKLSQGKIRLTGICKGSRDESSQYGHHAWLLVDGFKTEPRFSSESTSREHRGLFQYD